MKKILITGGAGFIGSAVIAELQAHGHDIAVIDNLSFGNRDFINVPDGQAVSDFFAERMPDEDAGDYLIRVNRQPVARDQTLRDGDRISITPVKIEGALAGEIPSG